MHRALPAIAALVACTPRRPAPTPPPPIAVEAAFDSAKRCHGGLSRSVAASSTSALLVTVGDGTIGVWSFPELRPLRRLVLPDFVSGPIVLSPGGTRAAVGARGGGYVVDLTTAMAQRFVDSAARSPLRALTWSADGARAVFADPLDDALSSDVVLVNVTTGEAQRVRLDGWCPGAGFAGDGALHALSFGVDIQIVRVDANGAQLIERQPSPTTMLPVFFVPFGSSRALISFGKGVQARQLGAETAAATMLADSASAYEWAASAAGTVAGTRKGELIVWDGRSGAQISRMKVVELEAHTMTEDGRIVGVFGHDGCPRIIDGK